MTEVEESRDSTDGNTSEEGEEPGETDAPEGEHERQRAPEDEHEEDVDELVARVAAHDEDLAVDVGALRSRVDELEADLADRIEAVDDLESRLKRARADLQNYKKRAQREQERIKERATKDLTERLLDVRDNLVRALEQDADVEIRDGVEATLSTFDRILADEGVSEVRPEPGDEVDPQRHEVVYRVESDRPAGEIAEVYRAGYELADDIIRSAQVAVAEEDDATEEATDETSGEDLEAED